VLAAEEAAALEGVQDRRVDVRTPGDDLTEHGLFREGTLRDRRVGRRAISFVAPRR
jgi:hypothetical protein